MKRILFITYYWPPCGGPGVQRSLKFIKYLPQFGYIPDVITVDPEKASYPLRDQSLLEEVPPNINVYYTETSEPFGFYKHLSGKKEIPYPGFANEGKPGFIQKATRFVRGNVFIPDARKGWTKFVYEKVKELIAKNKYDAVIISTPPHSTQLLGLKLKKEFGIKWIADMRDPWTDIYYYKEMLHLSPALLKDKNYERKVLENADEILVVSKDIKRIFSEKSELINPDKIHIIPNGYDDDDFIIPPEPSSGKFIISYTGTIAGNYNINNFLKAIAALIKESPTLPILLRFVGKAAPSIKNLVCENKLENVTEFISHVSHRESIRYMMKSTVLLLAIPDIENNAGILTGKLFEYLASRKPIINIGPVKGDAAVILDECIAGSTFDYNDALGIEQHLQFLILKWQQSKNLDTTTNFHEKFSRYNLTAILSKIIPENHNGLV